MRAWLVYAALSLVVGAAGWGAAVLIGSDPASNGVAVSAAIAWAVQVMAFAFLVQVRSQPTMFLAAFVSGMVLRLAVVGGIALWVTRTGVFPAAPTLLSLVAFLFVMLMLEPVFLKKGQPPA